MNAERLRPVRLTVARVMMAWAVFLLPAALILPNLDSHARSYPVVKVTIAVFWVSAVIVTPASFAAYFTNAWRRITFVDNRSVYVLWLSLETIAAVAFVAFLLVTTVAAVAEMR
jgi:hypothetical protein